MTYKKIFKFWLPLAATWLMMSIEGPFLSAVIARIVDAKYNLAAYGVAFSFALIIEAPVIMMMSASTALVKDNQSYLKLKRFAYGLNYVVTGIMLLFVFTPLFDLITKTFMNLPEEVRELTHLATILLIPWPGMIGYRRFYQGILIKNNLTRRVAYGTIIRLVSMAATALILYYFFDVPGVVVGAGALSAGVTAEGIASKLMALRILKEYCADDKEYGEELDFKYIFNFYLPLALTSIITLAAHPTVTFFLGHSRQAINSLAVLPVLNALVFIFRSLGLSFQEVGIALMGEGSENYYKLRNFAAMLGVFVVACLGILAATPLANLWFEGVSGLSAELAEFAESPLLIMVIMPALTILISFQRAVMVNFRKTKPVTIATGIEISGMVIVLLITIHSLNLIGIIAAAIAYVLGRLAANAYLMVPFRKVLKRMG